MKKTVIGVGAACLALVAGCARETEQPEAPPTSAVVETETPSPEPTPETLTIGAGLTIVEEHTLRLYEGNCGPDNPYLAPYFVDLEGSDATIRDAAGTVVGVAQFETYFEGEGCTWQFMVDVPHESDFYSVDFLGLSSPVTPASSAVDGKLEIDLYETILADIKG